VDSQPSHPQQPPTQVPEDAAFKYFAFISYSHQDNRERRVADPPEAPNRMPWGNWVHNALETYRVPRPFPGQRNKRGEPIPARLVPCFRDEAELPTEARLQTVIEEALRQSRFLIVICSPRSARSVYVNAEVAFFKKLGRGDRILPLIVAGEPNAASAVQKYGFTPEDECFCPALKHPLRADGTLDESADEEPICADARWGEARRELAFGEQRLARATLETALLKLIAGLLGIGFDDLVQRERQRQVRARRQRTALIAAVMTIILAFALVALWQRNAALSARNEESRQRQLAQQARQKAEDEKKRAVAAKAAADELIRFMQYDLRDTLGKLGQLKMMEGINARIRLYHQEHPAEPEDQTAMEKADREQAVSLDQQGDIRKAQGNLPGALESFRASVAIKEKLAQKEPENVGWQRDLTIGENKVGDALLAKGDLPGALGSYRASLAIMKKLGQKDPDNAGWQRDLAAGENNVGGALKIQGDLPGALESFRASLTIMEKLTQKDPENTDWQSQLAISHEYVGDALTAQGDLPGALQTYGGGLAILEKLTQEDPDNADWQRNLSIIDERLGGAQEAQGDLPSALQSFRKCAALREKLAQQDPDHADWQQDLAVSNEKVGDILIALGDLTGALQPAWPSWRRSSKRTRATANGSAHWRSAKTKWAMCWKRKAV
jgi:tetratricopeptide (TPR) repeat protein